MEVFATTADAISVATTQGPGISKFLLPRASSILAISTVGILPFDAVAPPTAVRSDPFRATAPRALVRRTRRTRRGSLTDDGEEDGFYGQGDGDDGPFGGGGGSGGRGWRNDGYGGSDWEDSGSSSSDPAFDTVYEVICWICLSNCTHFAFKRIGRLMSDRGKVVPMRLVPSIC